MFNRQYITLSLVTLAKYVLTLARLVKSQFNHWNELKINTHILTAYYQQYLTIQINEIATTTVAIDHKIT